MWAQPEEIFIKKQWEHNNLIIIIIIIIIKIVMHSKRGPKKYDFGFI